MIYEQLLHDFVDGSLDYHDEVDLFSELRSNEGLRSELKMLIAMGRSAAHDIDAFVPAPESRDAIMARLGFSSGTSLPSGVSWAARLRGSLHGVLGGIVGAMLMALAIFGLDLRSPFPPSEDGTQLTVNTAAVARSGNGGAPPAAVIAPSAGAAGNGAGGENPARTMLSGAMGQRNGGESDGPVYRMAPERRMMERPMETRPIAERRPNARDAAAVRVVTETEPRSMETPVPTAPSSAGSSLHDSRFSPLPLTLPGDEESGSGLPPVTIEFRATSSRGMTPAPASLANASDGLLRDRALGVHYRLSDNESIGVEIGQEEFYQSFEEMLPNGDFVRHEQNPVLFWGGASYSRSFPIISNLRPFAGAFAGATSVGPLARISVGTSYALAPELDLFASGEMSALAYQLGGRWFLTPKYGISYGVRVKF